MRRLWVGVAAIAITAGGALAWQALGRAREYTRLLTQGDAALAAGSLDAAIEAYSGALVLRPSSMAAHLHRGEAYRRQHHDDTAIRDWREASALAPAATQPLEAIGDTLVAEHRPAEAAQAYAGAVAIDDTDPARLYKLGWAHYLAGEPMAAVAPLQHAVALRADFTEAQYLLGLALRDTQQPNAAIAALERAVRSQPSLIGAHEELADLYRADGRSVDEMAQLQAVAALDRSEPHTTAIALAEARLGDYDSAEATLASLSPAGAHDPDRALALGRVYLEEAARRGDPGTIARARAALDQATGDANRESERLDLLGRAALLAGDPRTATRLLHAAVAITPVAREAFGDLADACERLGQSDQARDALERLDLLEGDTIGPALRAARLARIGHLSLIIGDAATAYSALKQAADRGRHDTPTLAAYAEAAWRAGHQDVARTILAEGLAADPRAAELVRLRRIVR